MAKVKSVPDNEKVAIVTGGSRGIGLAICKELLEKGMTVVAVARNPKTLEEVQSEIANDKFSTKAMDVSNSADFEALIAETVEKFGRIDVLVNNAGITRDQILVMMTDEDWDQVIRVNLNSAFYGSREASKVMMRQRCGSIINMSSYSGLEGNRGQSNYAASKAGMIGMTKSAAKELAKRNVRLNCICPGFIETDMTDAIMPEAKKAALDMIPMNRMGKPVDIAKAVGFLASNDSGYVTGQVISIDGGMHM